MGLEAWIWASRLGFEGGTQEEKKKKEEEKIPHMCESIGHQPLRGRCPRRRDWDVSACNRGKGDGEEMGESGVGMESEEMAMRRRKVLSLERGCSEG